jgi:N-acetylglucosamine kinase-like BadF-type ATPase
MQFVGVDAGGTKTVCYLADQDSRVIGEARGPGASLTAAGALGVEAILRDVIGRVLESHAGTVSGICVGMAGVDRPVESALVRGMLQRIVTSPHVAIVNDALVALEAGAPGRPGIVVIAGTGSIAYGRDTNGRAARAGGWGYVLADEGSGYWLGRQALRSAMRELDGRGPATSLTRRLFEHYGVARPADLARKLYTGDLKPAAVATLASMLQDAAEEGDPPALKIIEEGGRELSIAAASVGARLQLRECTVVLAGGAFRAVPRMRATLSAHLAERMPHAHVEMLETEPAMGAVRLAKRVAAGESVVPRYVEDQ